MLGKIFGKKEEVNKITKKEEISKIKKLVLNQKTDDFCIQDFYILDDENAIVVIVNNNQNEHEEYYAIIHERLKNGKLIEVNRWYMNGYHFGYTEKDVIIKDLNLFRVQNGNGWFNALYDYKNDKFLIERGIWNYVNIGANEEILTKYNGFHAAFSISSDHEKSDIYSYEDQMSGNKVYDVITVEDGTYHAIINTDGTIRGNKLFKGSKNSFCRIREIIDLDKYESIEVFKKERKQICNELKQSKKIEYEERFKKQCLDKPTPYLDAEVAKILSLKK